MRYSEALGAAMAMATNRNTELHTVGVDDVALVIRFTDGRVTTRERASTRSEFFAVSNRERKDGRLGEHEVWAVARCVSFAGVGEDSRAMVEVTQEAQGRVLP